MKKRAEVLTSSPQHDEPGTENDAARAEGPDLREEEDAIPMGDRAGHLDEWGRAIRRGNWRD